MRTWSRCGGRLVGCEPKHFRCMGWSIERSFQDKPRDGRLAPMRPLLTIALVGKGLRDTLNVETAPGAVEVVTMDDPEPFFSPPPSLKPRAENAMKVSGPIPFRSFTSLLFQAIEVDALMGGNGHAELVTRGHGSLWLGIPRKGLW